MTTDYHAKIRGAQTLEKIATYIRAQGCTVAPMLLRTYTPAEAASAIVQYETDAQTIERCESLAQARRVLRERGYAPGEGDAQDTVHVTAIRNGSVYGHEVRGCDAAGCAGHERYYRGLDPDDVEVNHSYEVASRDGAYSVTAELEG